MHKQNIRLFVYSSLAIVALTLIWGLRTIPKQAELAERQLRSSLEQELIVLSSAVKASTNAMKFRLLDVLKAEGNDHVTRAFQDSPFVSSALLEWDSSQWKILWQSSKMKDRFETANLREWMGGWPLSKIANEDAFFAKVADVEGTPYFALLVPVRRPSNTPMLGVGIFPASQFGLTFAADQARDVRVFDSQGFAVALGHPAYLGASLKREPLVSEILDGDALSVRQEWKSEKGIPLLGVATRLSDSNLFASIETKPPLTRAAAVQSWIYLLLCAVGAIGLNWFLFSSMIRPLFLQLAQTEELVEKMRRQINDGVSLPTAALPMATPPPAPDLVIPSAELPDVSFLEAATEATVGEPAPPPKTPLGKIISAALRSLDARIKENGISVNRVGLDEVEVDADVLQMQTAIEEVLKNAVEAMSESQDRQLTIRAQRMGKRANLTIEDTGCGIAAPDVKKVFDPFFSTKDSQGVARGLGLNVVRRVVEELEGIVEVRNRTDGGVRVEIDWPLEKGAVAETQAETPTEQEPVLDLFEDDSLDSEEFASVPVSRTNWPDVPIRKPVVRTLD
ncbi:MAG: ATP-binding protein [Bdellovibrionales bacterium]|nr:ATP-binding protein [Bdellovibrionales bacterium]